MKKTRSQSLPACGIAAGYRSPRRPRARQVAASSRCGNEGRWPGVGAAWRSQPLATPPKAIRRWQPRRRWQPPPPRCPRVPGPAHGSGGPGDHSARYPPAGGARPSGRRRHPRRTGQRSSARPPGKLNLARTTRQVRVLSQPGSDRPDGKAGQLGSRIRRPSMAGSGWPRCGRSPSARRRRCHRAWRCGRPRTLRGGPLAPRNRDSAGTCRRGRRARRGPSRHGRSQRPGHPGRRRHSVRSGRRCHPACRRMPRPTFTQRSTRGHPRT